MCFACAAIPGADPALVYDFHLDDALAAGSGSAGAAASSAPWTWDQIAGQLTDGYWNANGGARFSFDMSLDRIITVDLSRLSSSAAAIAQNALSQWGAATGITFTNVGSAPTLFTERADAASSTATAYTINANSVVTGGISNGDVDFYKVTLTAGQSYMIGMSGYAAGSALDSILSVRDSAGNVISGLTSDSDNPAAGEYINFTATKSGTYYIVADGYLTSAGAYQLSVQTTADITFNDMDNTGAYAFSEIGGPGGQTTLRSYVNIADDWSTLSMNSYMLQTYIHEIGHALGLGHAGNYNGSANFATNALYSNDSWLASVMSYFDQVDNTSVPGSFAYVSTIMPADIIAIQNLYGAGTSGYQTGDTVWGPGGNMGNTLQSMLNMWANLVPDVTTIFNNQPMAFSVYDTAGSDTLDFSAFGVAQEILLSELQYSDIGGLIDNVVIARGTLIENAKGGAGGDTITGNDLANTLEGGGGADKIDGGSGFDTASYASSTAGVTVNLNLSTAQVSTGDAAGDILTSIENLAGSAQGDSLTGNAIANILAGGAGGDTLSGAAGADVMNGDQGNDTFNFAATDVGTGLDQINGGGDTDTINLANFGLAAWADLASSGTEAWALLNGAWVQLADTVSVENVVGTVLNDYLWGDTNANRLEGWDGSDLINGRGGNDTLFGGSGSDRFEYTGAAASAGLDQVDGGEGADSIDFSSLAAYAWIDLANNGTEAWALENGTWFQLANTVAVEDVIGTSLRDELWGDMNDNRLEGRDGSDIINGRGGNDTLFGGTGSDRFEYVGAAKSLGLDQVDGGEGTDTIDFSSLAASGWIDLTHNGTEAWALENGTWSQIADMVSVEDVIGTSFGDEIWGDANANRIDGRDGSDVINGRGGNDTLSGGSGNDKFEFIGTASGLGLDQVDGGEGVDMIDFAGLATYVWVDLAHNGTEAWSLENGTWVQLANTGSVENVVGTSFSDEIWGDMNANTLEGRGGSDAINGRGGNDTLFGGSGSDTFLYDSLNWGQDIISDYQDGFDKIDLAYAGLDFSDFTVAQSAADTLLTLTGTSQTIRLLGVNATLITGSDFI